VHATIQRSFSSGSIQASAGYQSCPLLGTEFLWLFLKLDNCVLVFFLQEPNDIVLHLAKGSCREIVQNSV